MISLGIDTSNYTTSCALYDSEKRSIIQKKKLLPVKPGEKGLRQSDAVFHHTVQLFPLIEELLGGFVNKIDFVGVSDKPRDVDGSYMPCFNVGLSVASCIASALKIPLFCFSHQSGHIVAALYSSDSLDLMKDRFIAFHVSGGTTESLLVKPDKEKIIKADIICNTLDLNCGQAIDRAGVMMGLDFPCGKEIEALALNSKKFFNPKICVNNGNCNLSGLENMCQKMFDSGESKSDISKFCLDYVAKTICKMAEYSVDCFGNIPLVFAGGVMSDKIIREILENKFNALFAEPDFSCDNAAGTAILAYLRGYDRCQQE